MDPNMPEISVRILPDQNKPSKNMENQRKTFKNVGTS